MIVFDLLIMNMKILCNGSLHTSQEVQQLLPELIHSLASRDHVLLFWFFF